MSELFSQPASTEHKSTDCLGEKEEIVSLPNSRLDPIQSSVGRQLQMGREAKGLTVQEASRILKLSCRQVEALEADDWSSLPGKTIIRGFIRNYARLLGLEANGLMVELDGLALPKSPELRMSIGTPVSMPREGKADHRDTVRVLAGLIVLVLAVLAFFFFPSDLWQSTLQSFKTATQSSEVVTETRQETTPDLNEEIKSVSSAQTESVQSAESTAPLAETNDNAPDSPVQVPSIASANVLKFGFSQPSWVEVRDRNGQVIFSQKNLAGSQRDVEGQPPFSLVVGNATHVTVSYRGKNVDLSKRSKEDVARVTVE